MSEIVVKDFLESGVHFGHRASRWNPKMRPYIYARRNQIHIIDLKETLRGLIRAKKYLARVVSQGSLVLFVGTKRQAAEHIADAARRSAQYYINSRWLGGTLTNWKTISNSIKRLKALEEQLSGDTHGLTKKEVLQLTRERDKLELSLGGIRDILIANEVVGAAKLKNLAALARRATIKVCADDAGNVRDLEVKVWVPFDLGQ